MRQFVFFSLILALMAGTASSYTRIVSSIGTSPYWSNTPVPFWINASGYPSITNGSDTEAVRAAFHAWEAVDSANVRFDYRGKTDAHIAAYDGINMVSFTDDSTALPSAA